jgi:hypothetical protein
MLYDLLIFHNFFILHIEFIFIVRRLNVQAQSAFGWKIKPHTSYHPSANPLTHVNVCFQIFQASITNIGAGRGF